MAIDQDSKASEPTFRTMRPEDLDQVFDLIQVSFGDEWPKMAIQVPPREHLAWKISHPELTADPPEIAEIDGRIVGYIGGSARDVWVRGQRLRGWHGGDYCIHPDFQSGGLTRPWREWREDAKFLSIPGGIVIGEGSTHPRLLRSSKRLDNRRLIANKVDRLTLPFEFGAIVRGGSDEHARMSLRSVVRAARTGLKMLIGRQRWRPFSTPLPALTLQTVELFDERADALWERAKDAFTFAKVRDQAYLNWRYCDPRAGIYRVRSVEDGEVLAGFMVTGSIGRDAQIVDLLIVPNHEDALRTLVEDAIVQARRDGAASLTVLIPRDHPYRETFLRYGFIKFHRVGPMGFGRRAGSPLDFLETDRAAQLHVALGDEDHI